MIHLAPAIAILLLAGSPAPPEVIGASRSAGKTGPALGETGKVAPLDLIRIEAEDVRLARVRAEYARKREATQPGPRSQVRLADWCEAVGLKVEATAHLTAASRQLPDDPDLHARLGERRHRGVWKSEAEIAAEAADLRAQARADDRWAPLLQAWHDALLDPVRRPEAARNLGEIRDPLALPAVRWSFGDSEAWEQAWAARILGRIEAPRSTRDLARLAIFGLDRSVRGQALDGLAGRDPRSFVGLLINWLREPIRFEAQGPAADGEGAVLRVEGDRSVVERTYEPFLLPPGGRRPAVDDRSGPFRTNLSTPGPQAAEKARQAVIEREGRDIQTLKRINASIELTNARVQQALVRTTGEDRGQSQEPWTIWWTAELGYAYQSPASSTTTKPYVSESVPIGIAAPPPPVVQAPVVQVQGPSRHSCFAGGTPVLSRTGPRPIEELKVGDQVLSQDPRTGEVEFRPILAVFHNKPTRTLRVASGGETILATPIHRFWVAGQGWAMARDLKAGDPIRSLGTTATVGSVTSELVRPVYNLEVAGGHSFFVGEGHYLVHDNSLVGPTDRIFDRPESKTAAVRPAR